jgi:hypothetical protein
MTVDNTDNQGDQGNEEAAEIAAQLQQMQQDSLNAREYVRESNSKMAAAARALSGEKEEEPDPEEWSNDLLRDLMEAEKQGQKLPISSKMFKQLYNISKENTESSKIIRDLQRQVSHLSNPITRVDQNAYAQVDDQITQQLEELYGEPNPVMADSVRASMVETIKYIQREDPSKWEQIRRDPAQLNKLIQYTVTQALPPAVVERLQAEAEANTPLTYSDIQRAYHEMKHSPEFRQLPANERQRIQTQIRHAELDMREQARRRR